MSQVTRCPSCGTRFKVVADQLRISQGWVRCGMCQNVFDASQDLQTVSDQVLESAIQQQAVKESAYRPPAQESVSSHTANVSADMNAPVLEADSQYDEWTEGLLDQNSTAKPAQTSEASDPPLALKSDSAALTDSPADQGANSLPEQEAAEPSFVDQAKPLVEPESSVDEVLPVAAHDPLTDVNRAAPQESVQDDATAADTHVSEAAMEAAEVASKSQDDAGEIASADALLSTDVDDVRREVNAAQLPDDESEKADAAASLDEPGFVRQARRQAFWHSTGVRVALVLGSLLGVAGMGAQYALQQRDALVAQYPELTPAFQKACELLGCELKARREIADVVISGSGFKQLADAQQYQWSLTLENRSDVPVATPVAELTLTDAQDKPLLRRVIDLQSLGAPAQLQARQEWSVNAPVQVQELSAPVSGYRALVFYP